MLRKIPLAKINDVCFVERVTVIFRCKVFYAKMPSYIKQENHMLIAHFSLKKKNESIKTVFSLDTNTLGTTGYFLHFLFGAFEFPLSLQV